MTRKLSLITAVGAAAFTVGAPAAFGAVHANSEVAPVLAQPGISDAHQRGVPYQGSNLNTHTPFDQARPASLSWSPEVAAHVDEARASLASNTSGYLDSHERALGNETTFSLSTAIYTPFDQVRPATLSVSPEVAKQVAIARQELTDRYVDAHQRSAPGVGSIEVSTINSGRDIEWPQIGFGFGIGLLLALGLGLIMRTVHIRPFAH
jgi:hypothetical protein